MKSTGLNTRVQNQVLRLLASRGYEVRRHVAARRQRMFEMHEVDLVLDVGAADGAYARQVRAFGYTGQIVSFEPLKGAFDRLSQSAAGDPRWHVVQTALGRSHQVSEINVASNSDSSSLLPMLDNHRRGAPHVSYVGTEQVTVDPLDEVVGSFVSLARRPFLKMDTQGFEREVIAGAHDTLPRLAGLQLELSFVPLYEGGMLVDEAIDWAYSQGFHLVGYEQAFASTTSAQILQADGVFFRDLPEDDVRTIV